MEIENVIIKIALIIIGVYLMRVLIAVIAINCFLRKIMKRLSKYIKD